MNRVVVAATLASVLALSACSGSSRAVSAYDGSALVAASSSSKDAARSAKSARSDAAALTRDIDKLQKQIARDEQRVASAKTSKRNRERAQARLDENVPQLKANIRESRRAERNVRRAERLERRAQARLARAEDRKQRAEQRIAAAKTADRQRAEAPVRVASAPRRSFLGRILGDDSTSDARVQPASVSTASAARSGGIFRANDAASEFEADYGAKFDDGFAVTAIPIEQIDRRLLRQRVDYRSSHKPGTVVVDTGARYLYLVLANNRAIRYGIGVGREGFAWSGSAHIGFKRKWPTWTPPVEMIERQPELAKYCADCGGMAGGPENPLGARALYLVKDGKDTLFRLHGTPQWKSIGTAASSGCIRLMHQDVMDLYDRVPAGSTVVVI